MARTSNLAAWADESLQQGDGSFAIAVCEANEPGYWTLDYRLGTLEEAKTLAAAINSGRGLSAAEALEIRISSMNAHLAGLRVSQDAAVDPR